MLSWLERRLGVGSSVRALLDAPLGEAPSWSRAMSAATIACLALCAVSGVGLSFVYAPAHASAWASVFYAEHVLAGGFYARSLHMIAAEATIVLGTVALLLTVVEGRHRGRRDLPFYCLALVVGTALAFCLTGNPLRWDNRGYFGLVVESNVMADLPLVGGFVRKALLGGSRPGNFTLARLHAAHTLLLPALTAGVLWAWARASKRARDDRGEHVYGDAQLGRDLALSGLAALAVFVIAYKVRAPLEAPADPLGSYNSRPEWYFESLYMLRSSAPPALQGLVASTVPLIAGAIVFALPWLDRDETAPLKKRIPSIAALSLLIAGAIGFTVAGFAHDRADKELIASKKTQDRIDRRSLQVALAEGVPPAGGLAMVREDPMLRGEELFREKCASCHRLGDMAPKDNKLTAPSLDGYGTEAWVLGVLDDPDAADRFGNSPYAGKMPSYTRPPKDPELAKDFKPMPKPELDAIARFLAGEAEGKPRGHDADGEKLIRQRCTSCHLLRGESDDPGGLAPELAGWASLAYTKAQIANPGTDRTYRPVALSKSLEGHMPRYDEELSPRDIDLLTRFVTYRSRNKPR